MPQLKIKVQGKVKLYEILEDSVYIGSSQECQIRVQDSDVAGMHCQIKKTRDGYKLIDLESKGGTLVNKEFVNQHPLHDGDVIRIGSTLMKFEQDEAFVFEGQSARRRLEKERGAFDNIPAWGVVSIVGGGALLLVVVILLLFRGSGPTKAQRQVQYASQLADQGQFERALEIIKETRRFPKLSIAMKRELDRIEERVTSEEKADAVLVDNSQYQKSFDEVRKFADKHLRNLEMKDEVLARFDSWWAQNPDAPAFLKENFNNNLRIIKSNYEKLENSKKKRDNW